MKSEWQEDPQKRETNKKSHKEKTIQKEKVNNTDGEVKKICRGRKTDRKTFVYREKRHKKARVKKNKMF